MGGEGGRREKENNHSLPHLPWHLGFSSLLLCALSAVLLPDWSLTPYNSVCTRRPIPTNTVHFLWISPESTASFLRWQWAKPHTAHRYSMDWYTRTPRTDLHNSTVTVALEPSPSPAPKLSLIFDLEECWAENYHNLRSDNWTLTISSWPTTLHIHALFCIYITELCLFYFLSHSYLTSQSQPPPILLRKTACCQQPLAPHSLHPFTLLLVTSQNKSLKTVTYFLGRFLYWWGTILFFLNSFGFPFLLFWHFLCYLGVFWYLNACECLLLAICKHSFCLCVPQTSSLATDPSWFFCNSLIFS